MSHSSPIIHSASTIPTKENDERNLSLNIPTVNSKNGCQFPATTSITSEQHVSSSDVNHSNHKAVMEWSVEQVQSFLESKHFPRSMLHSFETEKVDGLSLYYLWLYSNQNSVASHGCSDLQLKLNDRLNIDTLHDLVHLKHELNVLFGLPHSEDGADNELSTTAPTMNGKSVLPHISVVARHHQDEPKSQHMLTSTHGHQHHHHFLTHHHSHSSTMGNKSPTTLPSVMPHHHHSSTPHYSPSHKTPTSPSMPPPSPLLLHTLGETPVVYTPTPLSKKILSSLPPSIPQFIKQILPSEIKILDEHSQGESWGSMITKVIVSFFYLMLSIFCTSVTMVVVHERVPQDYPPLPDIILDNVPLIPSAFAISELICLILALIVLFIILFHKYRGIIVRRLFVIIGTVFLLRCLTMFITSLSVPGSHLTSECMKSRAANITLTFEEKMNRAIEITLGFGLSIMNVKTCGDYMFSGHVSIITLLNYTINEYTPKNWKGLHIITWVLNCFGAFFVLAAHEHYSIDVFIGFYISSRLFVYYHDMANMRHIMDSHGIDSTVYVPLFDYLEEMVDGVVQNEFIINFERKSSNRSSRSQSGDFSRSNVGDASSIISNSSSSNTNGEDNNNILSSGEKTQSLNVNSNSNLTTTTSVKR
ncbi:hypothetical protein C9374_003901 [Naegleria lovaniensis]|uniref:Sphingomyelin synthase-like domain-containing protein n=1 Tax=Naegleria lovaniensis TaxID=51637 RepID=A0AA88H8T5_NAELO|nr:uncharacterized protein C9374_003901 [Naegleria lovaniensis]KAG2394137.1 hypothetical protein C9374_003901 [Naegleria lovaniensis]